MTLLFHCMLCERDKFQLHMYMFLYTCSNSELIYSLISIIPFVMYVFCMRVLLQSVSMLEYGTMQDHYSN